VAETRRFDVPYFVTNASAARQAWDWEPQHSHLEVLDEISAWALANQAKLERGF
jgi:nucleoside-diphosphate-sugar epimerase